MTIRLTSLVYAEKFEFENSVIILRRTSNVNKRSDSDNQLMAKGSDYFLSLDDKSKQRYKVKINNIQGYHPCQIRKEELSECSDTFH